MIRVLRAADRIAVPWKNGGGITREVAVWPTGAGFDDFDWRVSIAEVRQAAPFSLFPNIDRTLMILEGQMRLAFDHRAVELTAKSPPFSFPGDVGCDGTPLSGPVTDLNVMTRRGCATAKVRKVTDDAFPANERHTLVMAVSLCMVETAQGNASLDARDAAHFEGGAGAIRIAGTAYAIGFA